MSQLVEEGHFGVCVSGVAVCFLSFYGSNPVCFAGFVFLSYLIVRVRARVRQTGLYETGEGAAFLRVAPPYVGNLMFLLYFGVNIEPMYVSYGPKTPNFDSLMGIV